MKNNFNFLVFFVFLFSVFTSVLLGITFGMMLSSVYSVNIDDYWNKEVAIPSKLYDRNGELITEFFSSEKREMISYKDIPEHFIYALVAREDRRFFEHPGFDIRGLFRAVIGVLTRTNRGGASTITQQLVGLIGLVNRKDISFLRKLKEIWYSIQIEKYKTKQEILEKYINLAFFGHNTYGADAASRFYFGHGLKDITLAESAILVIQLSSPYLYSPINNPNNAKSRQEALLQSLVKMGYISQSRFDLELKTFWENYDYTRSNISSAFIDRKDRAPYFSEYIRNYMQSKVLKEGEDINKDGYEIYTTLDLSMQENADLVMKEGIYKANSVYQELDNLRSLEALKLTPVVDLLSLYFNIPKANTYGKKINNVAVSEYYSSLASTVEMLNLFFLNDSKGIYRKSTENTYKKIVEDNKKNQVEGALITLENKTGNILSVVGGSGFQYSNQFNRALFGRMQPGSAFKPLFYSAAIEKRVVTPATVIDDSNAVFYYDDGKPYHPLNYLGHYNGPVTVRYALAHSLNIPSIKILDKLGFDDAIYYSSKLLGLDPNEKTELESMGFGPYYTIGLGVVSVSPLMVARAYMTLVDLGKDIEPNAIRYVKDRNGNIIFNKETDLIKNQINMNSQIISPQAAYVTVDMMKSVVSSGTLTSSVSREGFVRGIELAGKTGTTDNWTDAWAAGFSPYYTSVVWLGFDSGGKSLGIQQTGASVAGPIWAKYMKSIHTGLPPKKFEVPDGLTYRRINKTSGLLALENSRDSENIDEVFIAGTQPTEYHSDEKMEEILQRRSSVLKGEAQSNISPSTSYEEGLDEDTAKTLNEILGVSGEIDYLEKKNNSYNSNDKIDDVFKNSSTQEEENVLNSINSYSKNEDANTKSSNDSGDNTKNSE